MDNQTNMAISFAEARKYGKKPISASIKQDYKTVLDNLRILKEDLSLPKTSVAYEYIFDRCQRLYDDLITEDGYRAFLTDRDLRHNLKLVSQGLISYLEAYQTSTIEQSRAVITSLQEQAIPKTEEMIELIAANPSSVIAFPSTCSTLSEDKIERAQQHFLFNRDTEKQTARVLRKVQKLLSPKPHNLVHLG